MGFRVRVSCHVRTVRSTLEPHPVAELQRSLQNRPHRLYAAIHHVQPAVRTEANSPLSAELWIVASKLCSPSLAAVEPSAKE